MWCLADLIDAPFTGSGAVSGTNAGGYTTVSWADTADGSSDDGLTVTPNGGDTTKTLFIPNAGYRRDTTGTVLVYGSWGFSWSADERQSKPHWPGNLSSTAVPPPASYTMPVSSKLFLFVVFVPDIYR